MGIIAGINGVCCCRYEWYRYSGWHRWYDTCQIYFVKCVSKIKHILSVIHYTVCGAICFQFTHFCCDDWENIYTLSYYNNQIGSMNYYPLFRIRSWNNSVRCMSFYILMGVVADTVVWYVQWRVWVVGCGVVVSMGGVVGKWQVW